MRRVERCPACDGTYAQVAVHADAAAMKRFHTYSERKYDSLLDDWVGAESMVILRCKSCGHHWYRDQPTVEQLTAMYTAGRPLRGVASPSREPTSTMLDEMHRLYRLVGGGTPSLLDYGSGFGRWARAAVQAGFRVHAFEPSTTRGAEPDAPFTLVHELDALRGMVFDVIQMEQVLEHVPEPISVLRDISAYCHSRTLLRITVPNLLRCEEGVRIWHEWPFNGQRAHVMAPFEHLHGFTPSSLLRAVHRAGFEPLGAARLLWRYPVLVLRAWAGRWIPALGHTFLIVRPVRA